jgi:hypothetical protein
MVDQECPESALFIKNSLPGDDAVYTLRYLVATKARTISQRKVRGV